MWQPIKTAPKTGVYILIARKGMPPCVARWFQGSKDSDRVVGKGWAAEWRGVDTNSTILGHPTHWMELLESPDAVKAA